VKTVDSDAGKAFSDFWNEILEKAGPSSLNEAIALRNHMLIEMEAAFGALFERYGASAPSHVAVDSVVMELVDRASGQLIRRPVELRYEENENGIVLTGEDMTGRPSSIVFLSDTYLKKLVDISGGGADTHKCK